MSVTTKEQSVPGSLVKTAFSGKEIPNAVVFLKRTAIEFLQILFGARGAGSYHYDSDDTKTEIQIADAYSTSLDAINLRPAIIVTRGPISAQGLGLGNNAIESVDMHTRDTVFSDLLIGSISIACFSKQSVEAEQLAHLVFNSFKVFSPTLRRRGYFHIRSLNIGAEALIEQDGASAETFMVPIALTALVQDRWKLEANASRMLEGIIVNHL